MGIGDVNFDRVTKKCSVSDNVKTVLFTNLRKKCERSGLM